MVTDLSALCRTTVAHITAGRFGIWTHEMGIETLVPRLVTDSMVAFLRHCISLETNGEENERKETANNKVHLSAPLIEGALC